MKVKGINGPAMGETRGYFVILAPAVFRKEGRQVKQGGLQLAEAPAAVGTSGLFYRTFRDVSTTVGLCQKARALLAGTDPNARVRCTVVNTRRSFHELLTLTPTANWIFFLSQQNGRRRGFPLSIVTINS